MAAISSSPTMSGESGVEQGERPQFRYPAVLVLMLATVVFLIASPSGNWPRAVAIGIEGVALVIAVATSRERKAVRKRRATVLALALIALVLTSGTGVTPRSLTSLLALAVSVAIPVALARGLLRLLRSQGVTVNAVAGSLAIYLTIGLIFAWVIGFVAQVDTAPYFAQHTSGTQGDKLYFSFTVLTTTGFGDFSPASPAGHAIAVIEMLAGQLYLVTVIGLLIGNFARRRNL